MAYPLCKFDSDGSCGCDPVFSCTGCHTATRARVRWVEWETEEKTRAISPGRILRKELDARGWTQKELCERMGRLGWGISGVVDGWKPLTPEVALELERVLGASAGFWLDLEYRWRLHLAREEEKEL